MKRTILFSILSFTISFLSSAQNDSLLIKVVAAGQPGIGILPTFDNIDYSSGHTPYIYNTSTSGTIEIYLQIENYSVEDKSWRVTRFNESDVPLTWSTTIVFSGNGFTSSTSNPWCSPTNTQVAPNNTLDLADGEAGELNINITIPDNNPGSGTYTLFLGDCTNFDDSVKIQINSTVGVKELNQTPSFSMYPNPSDDVVTIQLNNTKNGLVKIVDLVGNVIYSETISSSKTLNTSEFKNGIYFVTIESEGQRMTSRKLVVKH